MKHNFLHKAINKLSLSEIEKIYNTKKISSLEEQLEQLRNSSGFSMNDSSSVRSKKTSKLTKKSSAKKIRRSARKNRTRAVNDIALPARLTQIASDGEIRTAEQFVQLLNNSGWKTTSSKPTQVVASELAKLTNKNKFERVNAGHYRIINNQI